VNKLKKNSVQKFSLKQQNRKSWLRRKVRKFGRFGSILALTLVCDILSLIAVYTIRMSIMGSVKLTDLIVGLVIPTVLVPLTSAFYIFLIKDLDEAEAELDSALELAAKAQAMARTMAVGTMAAGIAHEINNPLAIIRGRADLARAQFAKNMLTSEKFSVFHSSILQACERISFIIGTGRVSQKCCLGT
jgi:signal transduction histidine kinase